MCILSCPTSSIANCKICTHSANNFLLTYVHVEDCNKCIKICASSWSLAKVILRYTVNEIKKIVKNCLSSLKLYNKDGANSNTGRDFFAARKIRMLPPSGTPF